jgi:hypothetical protein
MQLPAGAMLGFLLFTTASRPAPGHTPVDTGSKVGGKAAGA